MIYKNCANYNNAYLYKEKNVLNNIKQIYFYTNKYLNTNKYFIQNTLALRNRKKLSPTYFQVEIKQIDIDIFR